MRMLIRCQFFFYDNRISMNINIFGGRNIVKNSVDLKSYLLNALSMIVTEKIFDRIYRF